MSRPYIIAIVVGVMLGMFALLSEGFLLQFGFNDFWKIPGWGLATTFHEPEKLPLLYQALLLRSAHLFLHYGFSFLGIPAALACLLWKLTELSRTHTLLRCFTRTVWFVVYTLAAISLVGIFAGAFGTTHDSHDWQENVYAGWFGAILASYCYLIYVTPVAMTFLLIQVGCVFDFSSKGHSGVARRYLGCSLVAAMSGLILAASLAWPKANEIYSIEGSCPPQFVFKGKSMEFTDESMQVIFKERDKVFSQSVMAFAPLSILYTLILFLSIRFAYERFPRQWVFRATHFERNQPVPPHTGHADKSGYTSPQ